MRCEWYLCGLKKHSIILAFFVLGCRGAPSSTGVPSGKVVAANSKACPQTTAKKLTTDTLALTADDSMVDKKQEQTLSPIKTIRNGGYLDVGFWSIRTRLAELSTQGNKVGDVEVVNAPYCTSPASIQNFRDDWFKRCLNNYTQRKLDADPSLKEKFFQSWAKPIKAFKRCTAHFSVDPKDSNVQNGRYRIRVWTAEHCYQPAYSDDVVMHIYTPAEKFNGQVNSSRGFYIPIPLTAPDPSLWRSKVLSIGQGPDALRDEKLLILRSTDARSSQVFRDTTERFCRTDSDARMPRVTLGGAPAKYADCYSMTEVATFKGTVSLSDPLPAVTRVAFVSTQAARKIALDELLGRSLDPQNRTLEEKLADILVKPFAPLLGSKSTQFADKLKGSLSYSQFFLSLFDGLQHGRRVEAFKVENEKFAISPDVLARNFGYAFSMRVVDFSSDELSNLTSGLLGILLPDLSDLMCRSFGKSCSRFETRPLDTLAMEEYVLRNRAVGFDDYLLERPNVLLMKMVNEQLIGNTHPLKVLPTDSAYVSNQKFLASQVKLWLDVMLLHNNPGAGSILLNTFARTLQEVLEAGCFAQAEGVRLFPILGNVVRENYPKGYYRVLPASLGQWLSVAPFAVKNPSDYRKSRCANVDLKPEVFAFTRSSETAYLVHVNDKALDDRDLETYLSSRVIFKFPGKDSPDSSINDFGDSGSMLTFLGAPSFVLSTHNGEPVNGIVLAELPELNDPSTDPDAAPASCK